MFTVLPSTAASTTASTRRKFGLGVGCTDTVTSLVQNPMIHNLSRAPVVVTDGMIAVPDGPGLGLEMGTGATPDDLSRGLRAASEKQAATLKAIYAATDSGDQHAQCVYPARTRWLREQLDLQLEGTQYEGRYVIVDIRQKTRRPVERLAWFDPPSNPGSTILMHRQPDDVWRIDYQITTPQLAKLVTSARVDRAQSYDTRWSDHAPVVVDYNL